MKLHLAWLAAAAVLALATGVARADPEAGLIYCTEYGYNSVTVDPATAASTDLGDSGYRSYFGCAFDLDGTLYATVDSGIYLGIVDLDDGSVDVIGRTYASDGMYAIEVDENGTMYGLAKNGSLYTIDKSTARATYVGRGNIYWPQDLAFDSEGTLWAVDGRYLYTINTSTGEATRGARLFKNNVMSIQFDENDTLYAMPYDHNAALYTVDPYTGEETLVGYTGLAGPHGGDIFIDPDSDGDGIPDDEDHCINSDLSATVVIDGHDSGVTNTLFDCGCTMSDLIAAAAAEAKNHGQFVSAVSHLTNKWKKAGVIDVKEWGAIRKCAAKAKLP
ncbi:MAG: hypothetical protein ACYTG4_15730 [Planctomycetota bacterium]|jgi:hypothetical protein